VFAIFGEAIVAATKVPQVRRLMFTSERVGMGFNSDSGLAVGTPFILNDIVVEADPRAPGQEVFSEITIINTHEELIRSIGMSVEAQGRYGFFSGALKAQFAESTKYNSTSTILTAKVIVQNPFKRGRDFNLTEPAKGLLNPLQKETFTKAFGDSFVRGLQTGGEFYAVVRLTSVSTAKQAELAASLQAAYNGVVASAEFEAKFKEANLSSSTRSEFSGMMYQRAGTGEKISVLTKIDDILERVENFPKIVQAEPVAYEVEVATYDTLPLPLPTPEEQEDFLFALHDAREKKLSFLQTKNDLEFARSHPEFFEGLPSDDVLSNAITVYTKLTNAVMSHGIELSRGRMKPPRLFDPSELPTPIVVPAPIPLKRKTVPGPTIPVPDLFGWTDADVTRALKCLARDDVSTCIGEKLIQLAEEHSPGEAFPDGLLFEEDNRPFFEFLKLVSAGTLRLTFNPAVPGTGSFRVNTQIPGAGALLAPGDEVRLEFVSI
jgi:hypothetical protein